MNNIEIKDMIKQVLKEDNRLFTDEDSVKKFMKN
jgi:hypothetical protein